MTIEVDNVKFDTMEEVYTHLRDRPEKQSWYQEKYNLFKNKASRVRDLVKYEIPQGTRKLIEWTPIIWKDRDWDEHYMVTILQYKLQKMAELHLQYGNTVSRFEIAEQIVHAVHLLELTKLEDLIDTPSLIEEDELRKERAREAFAYIADNMNGWWD